MEYELSSGVNVTYHRIVDMHINYKDGYVLGTIGSYIDRQARDANKLPVQLDVFRYTLDTADCDPRVEVYEKLMLDKFVGSTSA